MKKINLKNFAVLPLVTAALFGCSEKGSFEVATPIVETFTIPQRNSEHIQDFPAVVSASDLTRLSFRVGGELVDVPVQNGQKVKKGDLIAKIDPTTFELTVKDRKAKTELTKLSMNRAKEMVALGNMAKSIYDELEAKHRVAKANYDYAKLQLSYVELRAPFDGVIANVPADNFQNTSTGQLVAIMHRIDKIEIRVDLPDVILASTQRTNEKRQQLKLNLKLDAYPDHSFITSYKEHTTEQTDKDKKYILVLEMPVDTKRIALQGMPGSVEIDLDKLKTKKSDVNKVPVEAVLFPDGLSAQGNELIVWRVNDDSTVEAIPVISSGFNKSKFIDVSGALNEGDQIVVAGMMYLKNGITVNVRPQRGSTK